MEQFVLKYSITAESLHEAIWCFFFLFCKWYDRNKKHDKIYINVLYSFLVHQENMWDTVVKKIYYTSSVENVAQIVLKSKEVTVLS